VHTPIPIFQPLWTNNDVSPGWPGSPSSGLYENLDFRADLPSRKPDGTFQTPAAFPRPSFRGLMPDNRRRPAAPCSLIRCFEPSGVALATSKTRRTVCHFGSGIRYAAAELVAPRRETGQSVQAHADLDIGFDSNRPAVATGRLKSPLVLNRQECGFIEPISRRALQFAVGDSPVI
jgi:hypothetical protein